jgi:hypothetical protein
MLSSHYPTPRRFAPKGPGDGRNDYFNQPGI